MGILNICSTYKYLPIFSQSLTYPFIFLMMALGEQFIYYFLSLCWVGVHLQKFLQYIKYIILEFISCTVLETSSTPSPIPGIVSTDTIFPFTYLCTQYCISYSLSYTISHFLPPPLDQPPPQAGPILPSYSLILYKKRRRKKWHFWLFKIATQGFSLWHFHLYM
jgi:hypothetical protein